jgi:hypothetical protein
MDGFMLSIDPYFDVHPAINRTISKIYRDTRFSNDKSPFKTTMWITFKRPEKNWKDAPAVCNRCIDQDISSGQLIDTLIEGFGTLSPLYHYLWEIKSK